MCVLDCAVQDFGPEVYDIFRPHWLHLKNIMNKTKTSAIPKNFESLTFILRIDGSLGSFHGDGLDNLRVSETRRYISIDICLPESRWKNKPDFYIANTISSNIVSSAALIYTRLRKKHIQCDEQALTLDLEKVAHKYIKSVKKM